MRVLNICYNCFESNHFWRDCLYKNFCDDCGKNHYKLLNFSDEDRIGQSQNSDRRGDRNSQPRQSDRRGSNVAASQSQSRA